MAFKFAEGIMMVLVIIASMFSHTTMATLQPKEFIVGGDAQHWSFGFNYQDWATKNAPFHVGDTLVFKYDAPNPTTHEHNVYQFPDTMSFRNCDFTRAKLIANGTQGAGEGFKFVLNESQPFHFGCGEKNGFHCINGTMKFSVRPLLSDQ